MYEREDAPDMPFPGLLPLNPEFGQLFKDHIDLVEDLGRFDIAELVPIIGGLLTSPDWQASTLRLEVLQHMAVAAAHGEKDLKPSRLKFWLEALGGGLSGRMEDPAEDVFVSRVILSDRDCLIFEGLYEASAFYLQRFINVLQAMPEGEPFAGLRRSADSLLRLSQEVAARSGVQAHMVGEVLPLRSISYDRLRGLPDLAARVTFSADELRTLGVDLNDLAPFIFDPTDRNAIPTETLGYSTLERSPVLAFGDDLFCLALPTAVSIAIRRMVIEFALSADQASPLYGSYAREIASTFEGLALLGGRSASLIPFQKMDGIYVANMATYVDEGRVLHVCFFVDEFDTYSTTGMVGRSPDVSRLVKVIDAGIANTHKDFAGRPGFREGVSLLVMCPWGRPAVFGFNGVQDKRWRYETISAADLETISWIPKFSPLALWRMLDSRDRLQEMGVEIMNANGLLNLYAWAEQLKGHLVPHEDMSDDHDTNHPFLISIPSNGLLDVRKEGAERWNLHHATTWDSRSVKVRREAPKSFFEANHSPPLYVSMDDLNEKRLLAVFETGNRGWWSCIETPNSQDRDLHYRLWHLTTVWIARAAPVLEEAIPALPDGPIAWICRFEDSEIKDLDMPVPARNEARTMLHVEVERNVIRVRADAGFLPSFRQPTNVGESLLVEALVIGALRLGSREATPERTTELLSKIVPDDWARDMHMFEALRFRQFVQDQVQTPILISKMDDAYSRLGIGWRKRARSLGPRIEGIDACCAFLNSVIDGIWEEMRATLKGLNREKLLEKLVANHESVSIETDTWLRTARAILSLHGNTPEAALASVRQISKYNAGLLSTRLVVEMALCESPEADGIEAGTLEVARLMANAIQIHYLGGWSEAIRFGSKTPRIRITPLGDIHTEIGFDEEIVTPYGEALGTKRFRHGARRYEEHFEKLKIVETAEDSLDAEFWNAWKEHFGFTIDDLRIFLDNIENEGIRRRELLFTATFAELAALEGVGKLESESVRRILDALTSKPRPSWASTPAGFLARDWYPWRFRRRLSLVSRPLIQLNDAGEPRYLVAPGMVRDGAVKVIDYCFNGGYDAKDFPPGRMRSWIGAAENKRGHEFNATVSERLRELGWQTKPNILLGEILQEKLDRDYGDIDVLAWKGRRVLAIECKDLELAMTNGEIARQLHEFRGETGANGKPDRLKKHLARVDLLRSRTAAVAKYTRSTGDIEIQACLMFSDIVPMTFSESATRHHVRLAVLDDAENL